ncbi:MAG: Trm112 family protein [Acidimicrobiia bacterium]
MDILQCPACRSSVEESGDTIVCTGCGLAYPVRDGIPHMLVEEAQRPTEEGSK